MFALEEEQTMTPFFFVKSVTPGSPASSCGNIKRGDRLLEVDGMPILSSEAAAHRILGELGTEVHMRFERGGDQFDISLRRGAASSLHSP